MGYPFGQNITYTFYPLVDNEAAKNIPTTGNPVAIYYFTDNNKPSRDAAQNGTGAVNSGSAIASWTPTGNGYQFTIPAIEDPDPDGGADTRNYWLAINFILQASGQTQTVIRALEMERVSGHHKTVSVTSQDIIDYFPDALSYVSEDRINNFLFDAREEIQAYLRNKGFEWAQIYRPDRLSLVIKYKVLMHIMADQRREPGDNFDLNYQRYEKSYESAISSLQLEYDADKDGAPEIQPVKTGGYIFAIR